MRIGRNETIVVVVAESGECVKTGGQLGRRQPKRASESRCLRSSDYSKCGSQKGLVAQVRRRSGRSANLWIVALKRRRSTLGGCREQFYDLSGRSAA